MHNGTASWPEELWPEVARDLSISLSALTTYFGLGWKSKVVRADLSLNQTQVAELMKFFTGMSVSMAPTKLVAGHYFFWFHLAVPRNVYDYSCNITTWNVCTSELEQPLRCDSTP